MTGRYAQNSVRASPERRSALRLLRPTGYAASAARHPTRIISKTTSDDLCDLCLVVRMRL
jgi:hypothetical protein